MDDEKHFLDMSILPKLSCLKDKWVVIGSAFEPMLHPQFVELYEYFCSLGCHVDLTTNATLFRREILDRLATECLKNVTVSFDSVYEAIYEQIRRGASFQRAVDLVRAFRAVVRQFNSFVAVNMTIMRINYEGIDEAVTFWDQEEFDQIRFPFMVVRNWTALLLEQSPYPIRSQVFRQLDQAALSVINHQMRITLSSPYFRRSPLLAAHAKNLLGGVVQSDNLLSRQYFNPRHHFQNRHYPGMHLNCASPFTFARIFADGSVTLCNRFAVGSLHEMAFEDIWFGETAQEVRERILRDASICRSCDYRRFCLRSTKIDLDDKKSYLAMELTHKLADFGESVCQPVSL